MHWFASTFCSSVTYPWTFGDRLGGGAAGWNSWVGGACCHSCPLRLHQIMCVCGSTFHACDHAYICTENRQSPVVMWPTTSLGAPAWAGPYVQPGIVQQEWGFPRLRAGRGAERNIFDIKEENKNIRSFYFESGSTTLMFKHLQLV